MLWSVVCMAQRLMAFLDDMGSELRARVFQDWSRTFTYP